MERDEIAATHPGYERTWWRSKIKAGDSRRSWHTRRLILVLIVAYQGPVSASSGYTIRNIRPGFFTFCGQCFERGVLVTIRSKKYIRINIYVIFLSLEITVQAVEKANRRERIRFSFFFLLEASCLRKEKRKKLFHRCIV